MRLESLKPIFVKETNLTKSAYLVDACRSRHVSVKVHFWKALIIRN